MPPAASAACLEEGVMRILRRVVLSLVLALAAAVANPAEKRFVVTSLGLSTLSIDGGRDQGVSTGDRLRVVAGDRTIAELEVVSVAERWTSCRTISRTRPIATGDVVVGTIVSPAYPPAAVAAGRRTGGTGAARRARRRRRRWRPRRRPWPPPPESSPPHWLRVPNLRPRRPGHPSRSSTARSRTSTSTRAGRRPPRGRPARDRRRHGGRGAGSRVRGRPVGLVQAALEKRPVRPATSPG